MATLDADQLTDLRADIGDDGTVFSDAELHRLYTRAGSDYDKAVVLAFRQILANATKLHDYRIAQSGESLSQVYRNVKDLLVHWESIADVKQQVKMVGLRSVPPVLKDEPET